MRSIRSYQREISKLRRILEEVEWYQALYNGSPSCPCCAMQQHMDHATDCALNNYLNSRDTTGQRTK